MRTPCAKMLVMVSMAGAACAGGGIVTGLAGCSSAGIAMREKVFGQAKRDQLVSRVKDARDEQQEAKQQFNSALEQFLAVTDASKDPGVKELESRYRKLEGEYKRSESAAGDVRGRIKDVENVGGALFSEWKTELNQYSSPSMRAASERELRETQRQYDQMVDAMKAAESKMGPVLAAFKDQVLFLKHNLNARAIASLQGTATQIQGDVERLIREMEASINEANTFISQMGKS
jgi:Skp family chaperone for outer membrane proteins